MASDCGKDLLSRCRIKSVCVCSIKFVRERILCVVMSHNSIDGYLRSPSRGKGGIPFRFSRLMTIPTGNTSLKNEDGHYVLAFNLSEYLAKVPQPPFAGSCLRIRCIEAYGVFLQPPPPNWSTTTLSSHMWTLTNNTQQGSPAGSPGVFSRNTVCMPTQLTSAHPVTVWMDTDPCCRNTIAPNRIEFRLSRPNGLFLPGPSGPALILLHVDVYFRRQNCVSIPKPFPEAPKTTLCRSACECSCICPFMFTKVYEVSITGITKDSTGFYFHRLNLNEYLGKLQSPEGCTGCLYIKCITARVRVPTYFGNFNTSPAPLAYAYPANENQSGNVGAVRNGTPVVVGGNSVVPRFVTMWLDTDVCCKKTSPPMFLTWYFMRPDGIAIGAPNTTFFYLADFRVYFHCPSCTNEIRRLSTL